DDAAAAGARDGAGAPGAVAFAVDVLDAGRHRPPAAAAASKGAAAGEGRAARRAGAAPARPLAPPQRARALTSRAFDQSFDGYDSLDKSGSLQSVAREVSSAAQADAPAPAAPAARQDDAAAAGARDGAGAPGAVAFAVDVPGAGRHRPPAAAAASKGAAAGEGRAVRRAGAAPAGPLAPPQRARALTSRAFDQSSGRGSFDGYDSLDKSGARDEVASVAWALQDTVSSGTWTRRIQLGEYKFEDADLDGRAVLETMERGLTNATELDGRRWRQNCAPHVARHLEHPRFSVLVGERAQRDGRANAGAARVDLAIDICAAAFRRRRAARERHVQRLQRMRADDPGARLRELPEHILALQRGADAFDNGQGTARASQDDAIPIDLELPLPYLVPAHLQPA
ncbi:unnamed protein product, partial [Prorocentrum cordatum]